jgi:AraC-like DNA-binding protein
MSEAPQAEDLPFREDESEYSPRSPFSAFEKRIRAEHRVRLHYHENLEINILSRCEGRVTVNGQAYEAGREKILVLPPRSLHSYLLSGGSGKVVVVHLSFEALALYLDAERILGRPMDSRHFPVCDPAYAALVAPCRALLGAEPGDIATAVHRAAEVVAALSKAAGPRPSGPPGLNAAREERLLELIAFTERSCAGRISLDEAAGIAGLSRSRFCRWFKAGAGLPYFAYLEAVRIDRAKLLIDSGRTVTEACFESGFGNLSYFIRRFRIREGTSPGAWRRRDRLLDLAF